MRRFRSSSRPALCGLRHPALCGLRRPALCGLRRPGIRGLRRPGIRGPRRAVWLAAALTLLATPAAASSAGLSIVAAGLDQPKKLTVAPNGDLLVALSGNGRAPQRCTNGNQVACVNRSGAIDEVAPDGNVTRVLSGLTSISSGHAYPQASGPAQARMIGGVLHVLYQGVSIQSRSGEPIYGAHAPLLNDLVALNPKATLTNPRARIEAQFGPFEARHNPDHGAGTDVSYGDESAIDSDPYAFVPYRGGYAVADAGGNDVLFVGRRGRIRVLGVLPTIREPAAAGTYGKTQRKPIDAHAQAVPTSLAVGPDGALYVGELGGIPSDPGTSSIYRIVPGHPPTRWATGFTTIDDLAFDGHGHLLVLEFDTKGLEDPGLQSGSPSPGALIQVTATRGIRRRATRNRTIIAERGLSQPTGLAIVGPTAYIANDGTSSSTAGRGGEIVRLSLRH